MSRRVSGRAARAAASEALRGLAKICFQWPLALTHFTALTDILYEMHFLSVHVYLFSIYESAAVGGGRRAAGGALAACDGRGGGARTAVRRGSLLPIFLSE
ncbi:hypothetical protein EVAR_43981_1 [Eumeta japonica]|uniref:Uncharacterized protein n=1 Tax=Eumeta variegata TaxID=151549 RepID=A0A4C1XC86_EUMVA|nr:hypothetical protein EVAR_43981_1 [Eumeta japonica]